MNDSGGNLLKTELLADGPQMNYQWSSPHRETLWSLETTAGGEAQSREASPFPENLRNS